PWRGRFRCPDSRPLRALPPSAPARYAQKPLSPAKEWRKSALFQAFAVCAARFSACSRADNARGVRPGDSGGICHMIRSELIAKIAEENPHLFQRDVEKIVNTIFEEIVEAMARGDRVELRGFGAFSVKKRDARTGRNPCTGDTVEVEEKHVPFFKTGKLLRDRLNGEES